MRQRSSLLACLVIATVAACGGGNNGSPSDAGGAGDALGPSDAPGPVCGNGVVEGTEQCDDGNTASGDGCSATCRQEAGFICLTANAPCLVELYCGDGIVTPPEQCDDGNGIPGDGCSGTCQIEPNYACPTPGHACHSTIICGDGVLEGHEACDDGNTSGGDGCSADCSQVESGYTCPIPNMACVAMPNPICGDAHIDPGEQCDDGNMSSGDGCSSACVIEHGYSCPTAGTMCTLVEYCGNGVVDYDIGETCDDGNAMSGDGCSSACVTEPNYRCTTPDVPCVSTVVCGDGAKEGTEQCDDGNATPGDGCSATCTTEAGWSCPNPGARCVAATCGDGIKAGNEQCDLGANNGMNLGCTATCTVQPLWVCVANVCHLTSCGDGIPEPPAEECDDHNNIPYDGCSPTCQKEPHCAGGSCTAVCGDGLVFGTEQCDDGNLIDGDGCDHNCMVESGWQCANNPQAPAATLTIPILYRDMHYYNTFTTSNPGMGNPDFENYNSGVETGLVKSTLGSDGEPVFNHVGSPQQLTNAADFCWWYHEVATAASPDCGTAGTTNPFDSLVYKDALGNPTTLTLSGAGNVYTYTNDTFFPLDGLGWNASAGTRQVSNGHNFSFTSELHYPFTYDKTTSPTFTFNGDDDVWVFINGQLAVDIGGVHGKTAKSVQLTTAEATTLGLSDGGMYSIDVFQAERHTTASTYGLTLSGFSHIVSTCTPICGDGVIEGNEGCDDGAALNNNMYGGCASDCSTREGYCGDDVVNGPEQCDDGVNQGQYSLTTKTCAAGCVFAPYCGDGNVDTTYGEQCDLGTAGNTGAYGGCTADCKLAGSCGDDVVNGTEQCDDGINNGAPTDRCDASCNLKCGNGVVDPGEQCDDGSTNNTGGYGKCNMNCTLGPRCGDGVKSGPEQCDNGSANSVTAYGPGQCTAACAIAPYCGDGIVETAYGEQCDGGSGCTADCQYTIQ